ncbi:hypothetical protein [Crateriforma conspicua]|uniref:hypothetical protein n=1 Tax=Crateriforma conspicua TaxID=2527996 RepID=UPI0011895979|nr:hypothetical protein [Crateriforma conspicua]QDV62157.1 hypothetical protein Mal65_12900 [Crateriforma conspicua]
MWIGRGVCAGALLLGTLLWATVGADESSQDVTPAAASPPEPTWSLVIDDRPVSTKTPVFLKPRAASQVQIQATRSDATTGQSVRFIARLLSVQPHRDVDRQTATSAWDDQGSTETITVDLPDDLAAGVHELRIQLTDIVDSTWNRFRKATELMPMTRLTLVVLPETKVNAADVKTEHSETWTGDQLSDEAIAAVTWRSEDAVRAGGDPLRPFNRWMPKSNPITGSALPHLPGMTPNPLLNLPAVGKGDSLAAKLNATQSIQLELYAGSSLLDPRQLIDPRQLVHARQLDPRQLLGRNGPDDRRLYRIRIRHAGPIGSVLTVAAEQAGASDAAVCRVIASGDRAADGLDPDADRWEETSMLVRGAGDTFRLAVTNDGPGDVLIRSIELESTTIPSPTNNQNRTHKIAGGRQVHLAVTSPDWSARWTGDVDWRSLQDEFVDATCQAQKDWVAAQRCVDFVRTMGIDGVVVSDSLSPHPRRILRSVLESSGCRCTEGHLLTSDQQTMQSPSAESVNQGEHQDAPEPVRDPGWATWVSSTTSSIASLETVDVYAMGREAYTVASRLRCPRRERVDHQHDRPIALWCGQPPHGIGQPTAMGEAVWRDLQMGIARLDPDVVLLHVTPDFLPSDDRIWATLRRFTALPTGDGALLAAADSHHDYVIARAHRVDDKHGGTEPIDRTGDNRTAVDATKRPDFLTLGNLAPWPVDAYIQTTGETQDRHDKTTQESRDREPEGTRYRLGPGQWTAVPWAANAPVPRLVRVVPVGGQPLAEAVQHDVTRVIQRMGLLDQLADQTHPQGDCRLANGDFESVGQLGLIGWVHSQFPEGAVLLDDKNPAGGDRSLCLTNPPGSNNRTWVISDAIAAPLTGRLTVIASLRGLGKSNQPPLRLRTTLEGHAGGQAFRRSQTIRLKADSAWSHQQHLLTVADIPRDAQQLRLAIDSLDSGKVWIDDLKLQQWFPLRPERDELQRLAFLAIDGVRQENLTHAARLLQNQWSQLLLDDHAGLHLDADSLKPAFVRRRSGSEMKSSTSKSDQAVRPVDADSSESDQGMTGRIRSWLPQQLRF